MAHGKRAQRNGRRGLEWGSRRYAKGKRGYYWTIPGRWTKTRTHRLERRRLTMEELFEGVKYQVEHGPSPEVEAEMARAFDPWPMTAQELLR